MRKALVIGINFYTNINNLYGCANDAAAVGRLLAENSDSGSSTNFSVRTMVATSPDTAISRIEMREAVQDLFSGNNDIALFYFAGHGFVDSIGGYICASDTNSVHDGLSLHEVVSFANSSKTKNNFIILDSCHSGFVGQTSNATSISELTDGLTILTASTKDQYASEENSTGIFTNLFVDALSGGAANLVGEITAGSIYAHIDKSLGGWEQRPVFKTNVQRFISLRKIQPPIELVHLKKIAELFPTPGFEYQLDPSFEPERSGNEAQDVPKPNPQNNDIFAILQKYNRLNLLVPVGAPHLWHAAMESKACKLTALGEHYRRLVVKKLI